MAESDDITRSKRLRHTRDGMDLGDMAGDRLECNVPNQVDIVLHCVAKNKRIRGIHLKHSVVCDEHDFLDEYDAWPYGCRSVGVNGIECTACENSWGEDLFDADGSFTVTATDTSTNKVEVWRVDLFHYAAYNFTRISGDVQPQGMAGPHANFTCMKE